MFLLRVVKQAWPRPACLLVPSETPGRPRPLLPAGWDLHALGEASAVPWVGVPVRGHTAGSHPLDRRHPGLLAPIKPGAPGVQHRVFQCLFSLPLFSDSPLLSLHPGSTIAAGVSLSFALLSCCCCSCLKCIKAFFS